MSINKSSNPVNIDIKKELGVSSGAAAYVFLKSAIFRSNHSQSGRVSLGVTLSAIIVTLYSFYKHFTI